jgi:hypothetical protein
VREVARPRDDGIVPVSVFNSTKKYSTDGMRASLEGIEFEKKLIERSK